MEKEKIKEYYRKADRVYEFAGIRSDINKQYEFYNLLDSYAEKKKLIVLVKAKVVNPDGIKFKPDGTLKNKKGKEFGHWKCLSQNEMMYDQIERLNNSGFPMTNTLFENSETALLYQDGLEVWRSDMRRPKDLHTIIKKFLNYGKVKLALYKTVPV